MLPAAPDSTAVTAQGAGYEATSGFTKALLSNEPLNRMQVSFRKYQLLAAAAKVTDTQPNPTINPLMLASATRAAADALMHICTIIIYRYTGRPRYCPADQRQKR